MESDSSLSGEIAILACGGYPMSEMPGQLKWLIGKFGRAEVQEEATRQICCLTWRVQHWETRVAQYENTSELREWLSDMRRRAAEWKEDIQNFERVLGETGFNLKPRDKLCDC